MIVIVDNVTAKNEEGGDEMIVETAKGIEQDIKELLRCSGFQFFATRRLIDLLTMPQHSEDNPRGLGQNCCAGSLEECIL
jgi:hypothetical protein